jgi:hypothetical protein
MEILGIQYVRGSILLILLCCCHPYTNKHTHTVISSFISTQQSDIEGFYLDKRKTLKAFRKSKGDMTLIEDPDNYCIRGLEGYQSSKMLRVLRTQRASLISSILEEQDKQRIFNVNDPQGFMQISYHQSKRAVDRALQLAAFDEAFAVSDCKVEQWPDRSSPRPSGVSDIALLTKNLLKVFHVSESSRAA